MNEVGIVTDDGECFSLRELGLRAFTKMGSFLSSWPSDENVKDEDGASGWGFSDAAVPAVEELKLRRHEERDMARVGVLVSLRVRFMSEFAIEMDWFGVCDQLVRDCDFARALSLTGRVRKTSF